MIVIDVVMASVWMAVLLFFAGREKAIDERTGADRRALDELRERVESYRAANERPTKLADLLSIVALAVVGTIVAQRGATEVAAFLADNAPDVVAETMGPSVWTAILATAIGVMLSFTPVRRLEGAGASTVGSTALYLLIATIGAQGDFSEVGKVRSLLAVAGVWMAFHAACLLFLCRVLRAPVFLMAVGSQANVGGAASAPVVASAFHPALAPVGALLAVGGYVLGTTAGVACQSLLEWVHGLVATGGP